MFVFPKLSFNALNKSDLSLLNYLMDLKFVLFIPSFTFNLISVSKLITNLHCSLNFHPIGCSVLDPSSLRMIGAVELRAGLYILSSSPTKFSYTRNINTIPSTKCNVRHNRLRHPSHDKLVKMTKLYSSIDCTNSNKPCDTCHFAKQKRLPFPDSIIVSSQCFDLLHMDILGSLCSSFITWAQIFSYYC